MIRTRFEIYFLALFLNKQPIVWAKPHPVLWVRTGIVGKSTHPNVASNCGEVAAFRVYDIEYFLQMDKHCQQKRDKSVPCIRCLLGRKPA